MDLLASFACPLFCWCATAANQSFILYFFVATFKGFTVELDPIFDDKILGHFKSADDKVPYKFFNTGSFNVSEGFSFNPFGELVNSNNKKIDIAHSWQWETFQAGQFLIV